MWRFNDHTLAFEVVALKTIKPGEEITLSCKYTLCRFLLIGHILTYGRWIRDPYPPTTYKIYQGKLGL